MEQKEKIKIIFKNIFRNTFYMGNKDEIDRFLYYLLSYKSVSDYYRLGIIVKDIDEEFYSWHSTEYIIFRNTRYCIFEIQYKSYNCFSESIEIYKPEFNKFFIYLILYLIKIKFIKSRIISNIHWFFYSKFILKYRAIKKKHLNK